MTVRFLPLLLAVLIGAAPLMALAADELDEFDIEQRSLHFDDSPQMRDIVHPDWFKLSFLNLPDDLAEAAAAGKAGLMVYFGQRHCAYCKAMLEVNFTKPDIVAYTRKHFDVIALDIWSDREVVDMQGRSLTEKRLAEREKTQLTPTILFYDLHGKEVMRLRGYRPPYDFRAVLEYVADAHYKQESFGDYLARGQGMQFDPEGLNEEDFFEPGPPMLDRSRIPAQRPLVVFFEQGKCHACDVLHTEPLRDPTVLSALSGFEAVQVNMWSHAPLITPGGIRTTARDWARTLGVFYAPTLVFFDERGKEVFRIESVVRFHRLRAVLEYVSSKAYLSQPYFQRWRETRGHQADDP